MSNVQERWPKKARYVSAADDLEGRPPRPIVLLAVAWNAEFGKYEARFCEYRDGMDLSAPAQLRPAVAFADEQGRPVDKLILFNQTNTYRIASLYGDETDAWPGALVQITAHQVNNPNGPGMVVGIHAQPIPRPVTVRATPAERAALDLNAEPSEMPGARLEEWGN